MNIKIFFVSILLITAFCVIPIVSAQTMTDAQRQTLIAQLTAQIAQLTAQIAQITSQQQSNNAAWCYSFNNNLGYAQTGTSEVSNLHIALQKEGISYTPDDIVTYSTGTSKAVEKFQTKYKIKAQTAGYLGTPTRTKLNQLYACKCTPNWQSGAWSICTDSLQTRKVTDLNNCGTTTSQPAVKQSCTIKPIDISINGSDGPTDFFVSSGNGAVTNSAGINLTQTVNLQWTGANVSSCVASDTLTPTIFSGYEPSTGSQSVVLSGIVSGTTTNNKITDTFKLDCISTITGAKVTDNIVVNLFYTANSNCYPNWQCVAWSSCASNKQTRTCTDYNNCGSLINKPAVTQSCSALPCTPNWQATSDWSTCVAGKQTRTVADSNSCGVTTNKPATTQTCCLATCLDPSNGSDGIYAVSCSGALTKCATGKICQKTYSSGTVYNNGVATTVQTVNGAQCGTKVCTPSWGTPSAWGTCTGGKQYRTVVDANSCGVTTNEPATSQSCCSATCLDPSTGSDGIYAVNCSGVATKCSTGKICELTHSSSTVINNGVASTVQTLTGAQCTTNVCTPSWGTPSEWGPCAAGKQYRTVVDSNSCGVTTNKPITSQTCCSATCLDSSSGFDGAYSVNCSGVVTKCATGRTCEQIYSTSYPPYTGGTVTPIQTLTGSHCICVPSWGTPSDWGPCSSSGIQTRTVTDSNNCGTLTNKPVTTQSCTYIPCTPVWTYTDWGTCSGGTQARTATDSMSCGTTTGRGALSRTCTVPACIPVWTYGDWGTCSGGTQTRTATASPDCGTTTGREALSQACCEATCITSHGVEYAVSCAGAVTACDTDGSCGLTYNNIYDSTTAKIVYVLSGTKCCTPKWTLQGGVWSQCFSNHLRYGTFYDANNCTTETKMETVGC